MAKHDQELLKHRIEVVENCIARRQGLKKAAATLGLSAPGLSQYLDSNGLKNMRIKLGSATRIAVPLDRQTHIDRLSAIVTEGTQASASRKLDISPPAMSKWLKDNGYGPDYEADLERLMDVGD